MGLSKFEHDLFYDDYESKWYYAVSKQKYTLEQAEKIVEEEWKGEKFIRGEDGVVRWQIYYNEDNEKGIGWCLHYEGANIERACPVYVFEQWYWEE